MNAIVVDASALLDLILGNDKAPRLDRIMRQRDARLHVPALCDIEVAAGLRRQLIRDAIDLERAHLALADYNDLALVKHAHRGLLSRVLDLRKNFTAYDACYVALAENLKASLLSTDDRLGRAVRSHTDLSLLR